MKKDSKKRLFEIMERVAPNFSQKMDMSDKYQKILSDFPGHAKYSNPVDSPQYKWYEEVMEFMDGYNPVKQKAELVKFFQNNFLGVDYDVLQTPAETVSWWFSPEQQEFIKGELNAAPEKNLQETGEWNDEDEDLVAWKEALRDAITTIAAETGGKLKLVDVQGFDKYQGPYAIVNIEGKKYNVWTMEDEGVLWIEGFPYDNTSGEETKAGFEGTIPEIVEVINNTGEAPRNQMYKGFSLNEDGQKIYSPDEVKTNNTLMSNFRNGYLIPIFNQGEKKGFGFIDAPEEYQEMSNVKAVKQPNGNIKFVVQKELQEDMNFQKKIQGGEIWLDYYAPSDSEEYTDGETWYNRSGQQLRDPEEYNPYSDGYTPFGDEG